MVQENLVELKLSGTDQLLIFAVDVNVLADNINNMKENTEAVINASKEIGLELNTEKRIYILMCCP
jgi:hypothetical protein